MAPIWCASHQVARPRRRPSPEVRAAVERDWENDRRALASEAYYRNALKKYDVVIDVDLPDGARPKAGG